MMEPHTGEAAAAPTPQQLSSPTQAPMVEDIGACAEDAGDAALSEQAQTGDLSALTQLLSQQLHSRSVQVTEVAMQQDCLQISLTGSAAPVPNVVVPSIHRLLGQLALQTVQSLEVYGYQLGQELPIWRERLVSVATLIPGQQEQQVIRRSPPDLPSPYSSNIKLACVTLAI